MSAFKRLSISNVLRTDGSHVVRVTWALNRAFSEPGPYSFELWRGFAPEDTQAELLAAGGDGHWMYDESPLFPQMGTEVYYQVYLIDGNGTRHPGPWQPYHSNWSRRDWRLAREITRKEALVMRKFSGAYGWLLKRRYWGSPCPVCVDPVTAQVDEANCSTCFGTRFEEGYHTPAECWLVLERAGRQSALDENTGHQKATEVAARALAYPPIETGDIWVQAHTDQRYRVQSPISSLAMHRGIPLVNQVQLIELPRSDSVYELEVGVYDAEA